MTTPQNVRRWRASTAYELGHALENLRLERPARVARPRIVCAADVTTARDRRDAELRAFAGARYPCDDGDLQPERVRVRAGGSVAAVVQLREEQISERVRPLEPLAADDTGFAV